MIIPTSLQAEALEVRHAAHKETTGMTARAMGSIYWLGMQNDIARKMAACTSCNKGAPI